MDLSKTFDIVLKPIITIIIALLIGVLLILPTGTSPVEAYSVLFRGAFGNVNNFYETLARGTPFLFTGLAAAFAFRGGVFNIGAEGQMYLGAMAAALVGVYGAGLPKFILLPLAVLAAGLAGGAWAYLPGYMKAKLNVNIVISTIMMNNLAVLFTSYLATYPFKGELPIGATRQVAPAARFLQFSSGSSLNTGFLLGLAAAFVLYFLLFKLSFGYEVRGMGINPDFSEYMGANVQIKTIQVLFISGLIAGLGGAEQVLGVSLRFISNFSPGYAFTGITVALLGRLHPLGVVIGSVFFGALTAGALKMEAFTNVSRDLLTSLQAVIILLLAAEQLLELLVVRFRRKRGEIK